MSESQFWKYIKKGMGNKWYARRIEDSANQGTPDVFYSFSYLSNGWIELKYVAQKPRGPLKLRHFTNFQIKTLVDLWRGGTRSFVFIKVVKQYYLINGVFANRIKGSTLRDLKAFASGYWEGRVDWKEFEDIISVRRDM